MGFPGYQEHRTLQEGPLGKGVYSFRSCRLERAHSSVPFLLLDHFSLWVRDQLSSVRSPSAVWACEHEQFFVPNKNLESFLGNVNCCLWWGGSQQERNHGLHLFSSPCAGSYMGGSHPGGDIAFQDKQRRDDLSQLCSFAMKCRKQGLPACDSSLLI